MPSASPSKYPTTSRPSKPGETVRPTSVPTSHPSYNLNYSTSSMYSRYKENLLTQTSIEDTVSYGTFFYKGITVSGQCSNWKTFYGSNLALPYSNAIFNEVSALFEYHDYATGNSYYKHAYCNIPNNVQAMISALQTGATYEVNCNYTTWRVFSCVNGPVFCVNCAQNCINDVSCPGTTYTVNSCKTGCTNHAEAYGIVSFGYYLVITYPQIVNNKLYPISVTKNSMVLSMNVTNIGYIYCGAYLNGSSLPSTIASIYSQGYYLVASSVGLVNVTISNLSPDSTYNIICYSRDFSSQIMPFSEALLTKTVAKTNCCRKISFISAFANIPESTVSTYSLQINSVPTSLLTVYLNISAYSCNIGTSKYYRYTVISPTSLTFSTSSTQSLTKTFTIFGYQGCYNIIAKAVSSGSDVYSNSTGKITIISSTNYPIAAPQLQSVYFSSDASHIYYLFDSATNQPTGGNSSSKSFGCNNVTSFLGSKYATCLWINSTVLDVNLGNVPISSRPMLSSIVSINSHSIKAKCIPKGYPCSGYPYTNSSYFNISLPSNPVKPTVLLSTPSNIGSCGNIVIDLTGSTGNCGRPWNSVIWTVTGSLSNNTSIENYLNRFGLYTSSLITIPNSYLKAGESYTINVLITNFFGFSGSMKANVFVAVSNAVLSVTIASPATVVMYRYQSLNFFASASLPTCSGGSTQGLIINYAWRLFEGSSFLQSVTTASKDPRYFVLPAYSLSAGSTYALQVTVSSSASTSSNTVSSASVILVVGYAGVNTIISGGLKQTKDVTSVIIIDASGSYSQDSPSEILSYNWNCVYYYPSYGTACPSFTGLSTNSSKLTIPANTFQGGDTYTISVTATNSFNEFGTASVNIVGITTISPKVSIVPVSTKYNTQNSIILTGILSNNGPVKATWSCSEIDSSLLVYDVTTPLTTIFASSTANIFQININPYTLTSGLSYTFILSSYYTNSTSSKSAYAQVLVVMNTPPTGGQILSVPQTGYSANTTYHISTYDWTDTPDDYPLNYMMYSYTVDSNSFTVIQQASVLTYTYAFLSVGLKSSNYRVSVGVRVTDIYGGLSNVTTIVRVLPLNPTITSLSSSINSAINSSNPAAVLQLVTATTSLLNSVDCTVSTTCTSLHRYNCSLTARTCGSCYSGFTGVSGDSNLPCISSSGGKSISSIYGACSSSSSCIAGPCVNSICTVSNKSCPNSCSGHGTCRFIDLFSKTNMTSCLVTNSSCTAKCSCKPGYYNSDCSINSTVYATQTQLRNILCTGMANSINIQNVDSDVVVSRSQAVLGIFGPDGNGLSNQALADCTYVLTNLVSSNSQLSGLSNASTTILNAFSTVIDKSPALADTITTSLISLGLGSQSNAAINQVPSTLISNNIRLTSSIVSSSSLASNSYVVPQTPLEAVANIQSPQVKLANPDTSNQNPVGVILINYLNNPRGFSGQSSQLNVQTVQYNLISGSTSRRLSNIDNEWDFISLAGRQISESKSSSPLNVSVIAQNIRDVSYVSVPTLEITVVCNLNPTTYNVSGICSDGYTEYNVQCSGLVRGRYNVTCPSHFSYPLCGVWNGTNYDSSGGCHVIEYTSSNTTCYCPGNNDAVLPTLSKQFTSSTSSSSSRRLSSSTTSQEVVTVFSRTDTTLSTTFEAFGPLSSISHNLVLVSTFITVCGILLLGILAFVYFDRYEYSKVTVSKLSKTNAVRTIAGFFDALLPIEFRNDGEWYQLVYRRLSLEHTWLCLIAPYRPEREYRSVQWMMALGNLYIYLFLDSLLVSLLYPDNGDCEDIRSKDACINYHSLKAIDAKTCQWSDSLSYCSFKSPDLDIVHVLVYIGIITTVAVPLEKILSAMLRVLSDYARRKFPTNQGVGFSIWGVNKVQPIGGKKIQLASDKVNDGLGSFLGIVSDVDDKINKNGKYIGDKDSIGDDSTLQEYWHVDDELKDSEALIAKFLKAVRLVKLQEHADYVLPSVEAELLVSLSDAELNYYGRNTLLIRHNNLNPNETGRSQPRSTRRQQLYKQSLTDTSKHSRYAMTVYNKRSLVREIESVRLKSEWIKGELELLSNDIDREYFLMRQFLTYNFDGYYKTIAKRYLLGGYQSARFGRYRRIQRISCLIALPVYLGVMGYFIYNFNLGIGSRSTLTWIVLAFASLGNDIVVLQPLKIWIRWLTINSFVSAEVRQLIDALYLRWYSIINRRQGTVRDSHSMIQHFNPACRAARMFPHLPVSRFLLTLNDFDVPRFRLDNQINRIAQRIALSLYIIAMYIFTALPTTVQDAFIDVFATGAINVLAVAMYYLGSTSIAGVAVVLAVMFILLLLHFLGLLRYKVLRSFIKNSKWFRRNNAVVPNITGDVDEASSKIVATVKTRKSSNVAAVVDTFDHNLFELNDSGFVSPADRPELLQLQSKDKRRNNYRIESKKNEERQQPSSPSKPSEIIQSNNNTNKQRRKERKNRLARLSIDMNEPTPDNQKINEVDSEQIEAEQMINIGNAARRKRRQKRQSNVSEGPGAQAAKLIESDNNNRNKSLNRMNLEGDVDMLAAFERERNQLVDKNDIAIAPVRSNQPPIQRPQTINHNSSETITRESPATISQFPDWHSN
eukprot:gene20554-26659_t